MTKLWSTFDTIAMAALALLLGALVATGAEAQSCTTIGNITNCFGSGGRTVSCTTIGNITNCF